MSDHCHRHTRAVFMAAGLAGLGLLVTALPAGATTLRKMDLPELVSTADRVVHARAISSTVYWDPSETQILTDTTFEVLDDAKGTGPQFLTVNLLGGQIGEVAMSAEGAPVFATGDEVVLFTLDRADGKSDLVGYTQGVMRVVTETTSGAGGESVPVKMARSEVLLGVTLVQTGGPQLTEVRPSPLSAPLTTLLTDIRDIANGTRPATPIISVTPDTDPEGSVVP